MNNNIEIESLENGYILTIDNERYVYNSFKELVEVIADLLSEDMDQFHKEV